MAKSCWRYTNADLKISLFVLIHLLCQFTIHDSTIQDSAMHNSFINYPSMLTLYRDNSWYQSKKRYNHDMQKPYFLDQKSCIFNKLLFSLLIFSEENDAGKLVVNMWGNCSNRLWATSKELDLDLGYRTWTRTLKNLDSHKPKPWKTWSWKT